MQGIFSIFVLLVLAGGSAQALANTITYQGQLEQSGSAFNGSANLDFRLFDAASAGNQIGGIQEQRNTIVSNGQFQVELDFGAGAFDGSPRYLEIRIDGALITPRQPLRTTPQALVANTTLSGAIGTAQINAGQVQRRITGTCPAGQYVQSVNQNGTVVCGAEPAAWRLGGNAGTDSSSDFIGTVDAVPLEFRIANARGLRLEPSGLLVEGLPATANVIAGSHKNEVSPGVSGATISGGGLPEDIDWGFTSAPNRVVSEFGTVGGGVGNQAGDDGDQFIDGIFATVGGGERNTARGSSSTVGGGRWNTASDLNSTVGGGGSNTASGRVSTVGGGSSNTASSTNSTVGGGSSNTARSGNSTVGGGFNNTASGGTSTVGGGWSNTASGNRSTIGGGEANCAGGSFSWAGGRRAKVRPASDPESGSCRGLTYPGGNGDEGTFIWADSTDANFISTGSNQFLIRSSGGMGINTNTPTAALTVRAGADQPFSPLLQLQDSEGGVVMAVTPTNTVLESNLIGLGLTVRSLGSGSFSVCRTSAGLISACSSSERYKSDITPMGPSSELIAALTPVRFRWTEEGQEDIGLIAEEVASVLPEIVTYNSSGQVEGVEYNRLGPLLVAGFQEQTIANADRFGALETDHQRLAEDNARLKIAQQDLAQENAELRAAVALLTVQSNQVRELERRLAVMEERERENDDLRARLAALEAVLLDHGQIARTER